MKVVESLASEAFPLSTNHPRCRHDALECRWSGANVARNAWKVPTSYLQLDISWFNPRCPLSPPKRVHKKIFGTQASKLSIVVLEQTKLTKRNHSVFQAIPPYPSSIFVGIAFGPDHICFGRDMHVFKFNTDTGFCGRSTKV